MKTRFFIVALVLMTPPLASAQPVSSHASAQSTPQASTQLPPTGRAVARVNGAVLTDRDLLREEYTIFPYARQHSGTIPADMEPGIHDGAMQMIVFEELVYQEALQRKMTVPAEKMKKAEKDFRDQFGNPDRYQAFLQSEFNGSEQGLREKIRRSLLIDELLKIEVADKSVVTPSQLRAYYNSNPARFRYPESFAIQTISFIPPEKARPQQVEEARKRAEAALPQAKATKNYEEFGMLAEKISEDDYRVMMGDHKAVDRAKIAPEAVRVLLSMKPGQVTDLLQVGQIYTIIRLNQHIPAGEMKYPDVKAALKKQLESQKTNEVRSALGNKLRKSAKIEVL